MNATKIYGLCGVLSAFFFVAADVTGTVLDPTYSAYSQAISELIETGAPNKRLLDTLLLGFHGLVIPFAFGLHQSVARVGTNVLGPILLGLAGILGVTLTMFFPCDEGCAPLTPRGTTHIFIAIPMGFSVVLSILAFGYRFKFDEQWATYSRYSIVTSVLALSLAIVTVALAETNVVGVIERILTVSYLQWYVVTGVALMRKA